MDIIRTRYRIRAILFFLMLLFLALILRLAYLQIIKQDFFREKVTGQTRRTIILPAKRGNILDRNGLLLATTMETYSVYVNCPDIKDKYDVAANLAAVLGLNPQAVYQTIKNDKYFIMVKRNITDEQAEQLRACKLRGVYLFRDQKRIYLRNNLAAHVVGFVDQDNKGLGGIEYAYEKFLQGIPGKLIIESDPAGQEIYSGKRIIQESRDGDNLELTIDEFLQYISHKELKKAMEDLKAESAAVLVLDVPSGEILTMLSLPEYDPNQYYKYSEASRRNNTVQSVYEPGSIFKLVTVACGLDLNIVSLNTTFVNGDVFEYGGRKIKEAHTLKNPLAIRNLKDILVESLNIGAAKLALKIGKENFYEYIIKFNFGKVTGLGLPGESAGIVKKLSAWSKSDEAITAFGHSIAVTPLQMACATAVIANDGVYVRPKIIRKIIDNKGHILKDYTKPSYGPRVISPATARKIRLIMQDVVARGTGTNARLAGYSIAGKTGTSQKIDQVNGGYKPGQYISSFIGLVPGNKPRILILVIIDNPRASYYGGESAAPVFQKIATEAVRYLAIPPDL